MVSRSSRWIWLVVLSLALAIGVSACGGGSDSTSSSSGGASAADSAGLAEAKADFAKYQKGIGLPSITPLGKPLPQGKSVDIVSCNTTGCQPTPALIAGKIAELVGWDVKVIKVNSGDPVEIKSGMEQALRDGPSAVIYFGLEPTQVAGSVKELNEKDIPVIGLQGVLAPGEETPLYVQMPANIGNELLARMLAAGVVAETNGEANVGLVSIPTFPVYKQVVAPAFEKFVGEYCSSCDVTLYDLPVTSLGTNSASLIANFLQAHPDVNAAALLQGGMANGLSAALKGSGLSDRVGLYQGYVNPENLPEISSGTIKFGVPDPNNEIAYITSDALLRIFTNQSIKPDQEANPGIVWTQANVPVGADGQPDVVPNLEGIFREAWGLEG
jgi:ABC-type sugar transport system substrate-binding protein